MINVVALVKVIPSPATVGALTFDLRPKDSAMVSKTYKKILM